MTGEYSHFSDAELAKQTLLVRSASRAVDTLPPDEWKDIELIYGAANEGLLGLDLAIRYLGQLCVMEKPKQVHRIRGQLKLPLAS